MKHFIPRMILFAAAALAASGQVSKTAAQPGLAVPNGAAAVTAHLSPIPLYPASGVIPPEMTDHFLFFDPQTGELVVSYPENVDDPSFLDHPAARRQFRLELKKNVNAMVYVAFNKDRLGRYTYSYRIANQGDAKQDIGLFSLPAPFPAAPDASADMAARHAPAIVGAGGWRAAVAAPDRGIARVEWSSAGASGIRAGTMAGEFVVASALKPGFVQATVRGASAGPELSMAQAPARVRQALRELEESGYNQQAVMTLGPQFPESTNQITMAANFLEGILVLKQHGYLDANSRFVAEAVDALTQYLDGTRNAADGPAADYVGPALRLREKPAAGLEAQIREAMKISLQLRVD